MSTGRLELERISVGEHILLGGDNMDLALAYTRAGQAGGRGQTLDSWQFLALVHAVSKAKITLFEDGALAEAPIAVPSRGSSLFAKTVSTTLDRETLEQVVSTVFSPEPALTTCRARAAAAGCRNSVCPMLPIRWSASISPGFSAAACRT